MSENKNKRKRESLTETAELQADKVIVLRREVKYNDGQNDCSKCKVTPALAFYSRCKKAFALRRPGDWNTAVYTWTDGQWVDAESNKYWLLDDS